MKLQGDQWKLYFNNRTATMMDIQKYHRFGIVVPLIQKDGKLQFIFQIRSSTIRQPGEVCFPGGKVDKQDRTIADAAVRELSEELGISTNFVELIGELDYMITPFKLILYPFLGIINNDVVFDINKDEVAEIFFVPVEDALQLKRKEHNIFLEVKPEAEFPYHLIPNGEDYNWRTSSVVEQFYEYNGHIIWGLTARIFTHVLDEFKKL